jgi:hypothetical protein
MVARFFAGFVTATLLFGGALGVLHVEYGWGPPSAEDSSTAEDARTELAETVVEDTTSRRSKRRSSRSRSDREGRSETAPEGSATTGDDLRENEMRMIDGEGQGGEQQLTGAQIDAGFDSAMGRIRRCFMLAAGDDPVRGRLVFGLRIAGSGRSTAVNLSGPAALTTGECGECLRTAARSIEFARFDGPEMVVRYPITLE